MVYKIRHLLAAAALPPVCSSAMLTDYCFVLLDAHQLAATSCTSGTMCVYTEKEKYFNTCMLEIWRHIHLHFGM